nr:hypothetical protein [Streptomyces sudanensis]
MIRLVGGYSSPVAVSLQAGMGTRVSRGMLTTAALLRSAETCSSICTSPRGLSPTVSLAPPSARFSLELRPSAPINRMLSGVLPDASGAAFSTPLSPPLRSPLRMLPSRCSM